MIHFITISLKTFHSTMQFPGSLHRKASIDKILPFGGKNVNSIIDVEAEGLSKMHGL